MSRASSWVMNDLRFNRIWKFFAPLMKCRRTSACIWKNEQARFSGWIGLRTDEPPI